MHYCMRITLLISAFSTVTFIYVCHLHVASDTHGQLVPSNGTCANFPAPSQLINTMGAQKLVAALKVNASQVPPPTNLRYKQIKYLQNSMETCSSRANQSVDILIVVKSRVGNHQLRMTHREMWANLKYLSKFENKIKYGFVLGQQAEDGLRYKHGDPSYTDEDVRREAKEYEDMIIADFMDTYTNLTYKTMAGINWAVHFCPDLLFYISLDDDVYLSIPNLITYLRDPKLYPPINPLYLPKLGKVLPPTEHFYSGGLFLNNPVIRNKRSVYYTSVEQYPLDKFPPQISGYFIAMSRETINSFYLFAPYMEHMQVDDAFLAIMAKHLCIEPWGAGRHVSIDTRNSLEAFRKESVSKIAFCCFQQPETFTLLWDETRGPK